ncbi:MDR family MFS transporter [Rummeliibacillus pycnus]|uniref:MDR family MFS transporter n=1 Tax=Rummeliibacillus pycnus TaxID=101070 RepID=UPI000C9D11DC|nr:MDR family MFS transporter [Rummeliibacillus pycnus]
MKRLTKEKDSFIFIIVAIFLGNFLAFINSGTVNVALPSIMRELHTNLNSVQWIVTGFMLATGTIAPVVGFLGNKFGYKQLYVYALIGLTVSSALCGFAGNIITLIIFRTLQGVCSGLIQVATMTIIYQSVKKEKQAMAISLWTVSVMVAPAIGPTLGGLLTNSFGWKALFFSCVPVGIIATLCASFFIPSGVKEKTAALDFLGLLTVVIGNVSFLLYFTNGPELGWFSVSAVTLLVVGIIGMVLFIWRELTVKEPLLNLRVLKYPKFLLGTLLNCLISIGLYSSVYLIPLFLEEAQGASSFVSGVVMLPGALLMIAVTIITGKFNNKFDPGWFVLGGAILLSVATWAFSGLKMNTTVTTITLFMVIRYIGVGLATSPIATISMSVIPPELVGHATSIANWLRQAVAALSIAVFSSILAIRTQTHIAELKAHKVGEALKQGAFLLASNDTFLVAFIILVFSIPLSFFMFSRKQHNL